MLRKGIVLASACYADAYIITPAKSFHSRPSVVATDTPASVFMSMPTPEDEAKAAWLVKLDAPVWGQAGRALDAVAAEAAAFNKMEEDCVAQVDLACEQLSREDEAKRQWLKRLVLP